MRRYLFTFEAIGYGANAADALAHACQYLDIENPTEAEDLGEDE